MPRVARVTSKTEIYHIILRGINRQTIFQDDEDRKRFLDTIERYKVICGYTIYAYCIMGNHLHLLLKTGMEPLGQIMKRLAGSYVYWYNNKYERVGYLFKDRFKSEPVETDSYMLIVSRYIHQNPLIAGIVKNPEDYTWSSYRDYLNSRGLAETSFILQLFGNDRQSAMEQFKKFTCTNSTDKCLEIKNSVRKITDDQLKELIAGNFKIKASMIKDKPCEIRKTILRKILKIDGVSTRQLARVTGISAGIIWRL